MKVSLSQEENQIKLEEIYSKEKLIIWNKRMDELGDQMVNDEITFTQYFNKRAELRKELGFPAWLTEWKASLARHNFNLNDYGTTFCGALCNVFHKIRISKAHIKPDHQGQDYGQ